MPVAKKDQQLLDRFTLIDRLGEGGMGEVWLAEDNLLEERVALKFVKPTLSLSADLVNLLRQECRHARRLSHPNIVRVFDFHRAAPWYFLSMEYVDGHNIGRIAGCPYETQLLKLLPVIEALGYAHSLGIVHLDLKLDNIIIDNTTGRARLTDFGISAIIRSDKAFLSGGTHYALSPQLLQGLAPTAADDIYALGVLLYELFTGSPPFPPHVTAERILQEQPARMKGPQTLPAELEALVMRMLAKTAQERPASMNEIATTLADLVPTQPETTLTPGDKDAPVDISASAFIPLSLDTVSKPVERPNRGLKAGNTTYIAVTAGFVILLALGAGVFFYLPRQFQGPPPLSGKEVQPEVSAVYGTPSDHRLTQTENPQPWDQAQLARARREADDLVLTLLEKQALLQNINVERWSKTTFDTAVAKAGKGDDLFNQGRLQEAISAYATATEMMDELIAESDTVLHDALKRGRQALDAGDSARAIAAFELALLIDPDHKEATGKIIRARRLPEVIALYESAVEREQEGDLTQSQLQYRKAAELDGEFKAAHAALVRIEEKIEKSRFRNYMTEGLSALEREDYEAARLAFEEARALVPSSQAPVEGLSRLRAQLHLKQIDRHRRAAAMLESEERWRDAQSHYNAALKLDPTLVFAKQGKTRTARRASLSEALQRHIQHPGRLSSDNVLAQAVKQRDQALAIKAPGPRLKAQIETLSDTIERATTPVRVRLVSDNKTRVVVYKVGKLGSFESKELDLRPGIYTLVGMRDGYRDVRVRLTVVAGQPPAPVLVRCEEKI